MGKPPLSSLMENLLQLISGSELLYLLAEHAHVEAKIEPVESQREPQLVAELD